MAAALKPGEIAPVFEAPTDAGAPLDLHALLESGPVVLFFYPAALTPGCTAESCHFRDLAREFEALGAHRVGISSDKVEKQAEFSAKHGFDFPLVSDPEGKIAKLYGTKRPGMPWDKRATFVIGSDGRVVEVIRSETNMQLHADRALQALRGATSSEAADTEDTDPSQG